MQPLPSDGPTMGPAQPETMTLPAPADPSMGAPDFQVAPLPAAAGNAIAPRPASFRQANPDAMRAILQRMRGGGFGGGANMERPIASRMAF
jgi:hypothetical protein